MTKLKVSEANGTVLDWMVAKCECANIRVVRLVNPANVLFLRYAPGQFSDEDVFSPSTDWSQGGPIIERENIGVWPSESISGKWGARMLNTYIMYGPTALVAATRCYVASRLGDEVDVPEELM
jgi:hypothetical protein